MNNDNEDQSVTDPLPTPSISVQTSAGVNVGVTVQAVDSRSLNDIADDIINEYSLNAKQKMALKDGVPLKMSREENKI